MEVQFGISPLNSSLQGYASTKPTTRFRRRKSSHTFHQEYNSSSQFQFINSSGQQRKWTSDGATRQIVKIHAMRSYLQQRSGSAEMAPDIQMRPLATDTQKAGTGKFKLNTWARKSRKKRNAPTETSSPLDSNSNGLAIGRDLGPLNILDIPLTPNIRRLLHHYYHGFTQNSFAVNPEGCFFDFAKTDAALLHALLCLVGIHYYLNSGGGGKAGTIDSAYNQAVYHQTEAVRIVNQRLSVPESYFSDTFVGAVAILANCETMNGTIITSTIHVEGLKKMVELRGGLQAFNHNRTLQLVISWVDFSYSTTYHKRPIFPHIPQLSGSLIHQEPLLRRKTPVPLDLGLEVLSVIRPEAIEIMHNINIISAAISSLSFTVTDRKSISGAVYSVEYRLLSVRSDPFVGSEFNDVSDLSEAVLLAAHLFLHLDIRDLPGTAKMHLNMLNRLSAILAEKASGYEMLLASPVALSILLWALFVGAAAASVNTSRSVFIAGLRRASIALALSSLEDFEGMLTSIMWSDRFYKAHCFNIWQEIFGGNE